MQKQMSHHFIYVEKSFPSNMLPDWLQIHLILLSLLPFSPQFLDIYERKPNTIRPFGLRVLPLLESSKINPKNIEKQFITDIPSWCIRKPNILFDLHTSKRSVSNLHIMKQNFESFNHVIEAISTSTLMVPKMERKLDVPLYLETIAAPYVFLMALLFLLQKQKQ